MTDLTRQLVAEYRKQTSPSDERAGQTSIGAETVGVAEGETIQSVDDTFLAGSDLKGVPRGREALEAREIADTAAFQLVLNAVIDQLLGGEFTFPSDDGDLDGAEAELKALIADVLDGPHHAGADRDDLISSWVSDMATVGNAYAEPLPPADDSVDLPFVALKDVNPLTIRHNVSETGAFQEPAFYQAPFRSTAGHTVSVGNADVTPLARDDLVLMRWPGSHRSHRLYPLSPALQVKQWLTLLADSTTHHSRFYSDNELPPGLLTAREASQTDIDNIRDELEAAKGDPRSAPVVGTDARWVEVGGSAVDLNVIEEQKWFLQLVMAAFGITKTELAMDDQVNYETSEAMLTVVNKRVTQPIAETIAQALERQLLPRFDLYRKLDAPFGVRLQHTDPREERAAEKQARQQWQDGVLTLAEYRERVGDGLDDMNTTVEIGGQTIDYSRYTKPVLDALLIDARNDDPPGQESPDS